MNLNIEQTLERLDGIEQAIERLEAQVAAQRPSQNISALPASKTQPDYQLMQQLDRAVGQITSLPQVAHTRQTLENLATARNQYSAALAALNETEQLIANYFAEDEKAYESLMRLGGVPVTPAETASFSAERRRLLALREDIHIIVRGTMITLKEKRERLDSAAKAVQQMIDFTPAVLVEALNKKRQTEPLSPGEASLLFAMTTAFQQSPALSVSHRDDPKPQQGQI